MSKIMDLYAQEAGIEDLKPVYNKEFFESVQRSDERRITGHLIDKAKQQTVKDVEDWLYARAEFSVAPNDYGIDELFFENYLNVCEEAATDLLDEYIQQQALDISDEMYSNIINQTRDELANLWADIESFCVTRKEEDDKEAADQFNSFYSKENLGV